MKKLFPIIAIVLLLFSVLSCDSGLKRVEDGNVNYYIYPYLKFTLSPDRTYYIASVVEGAKLTTVSVPGFVHTDFGAMPVKEFAGFEDINDSMNLEEVILDVHIEKVSDGAFDKAENLKVVKTSGDKEGPKWAHLPELKKDGYHFLGWKAGDTYIFNGMAIDPENTEAVPVWSELIYFEAKESTHTEEGNIEYWMCKDCGKLFLDSYATQEAESVTIPTTGHEFGDWYIYREATCTEDGEERHECSLCDYFETRRIEAKGHTSDGRIYGIDNPDYHWYHCNVDDVDYGKEAHTYGDWRNTEKPGMSKERECSVCHHIDYTALSHIWHFVEPVEPDCTQSGNYGYWRCELHEGEYTFDEDHEVLVSWSDICRPVAGHRMEHHPYAAATCTEEGNIEYWYCTVCHRYFSDAEGSNEIDEVDTVIPKVNHAFEVTYISTGRNLSIKSVCIVCGKEESVHMDSPTGAFDVSASYGIHVRKLNSNTWEISLDEAYQALYEKCTWTDNRGNRILDGTEDFTVTYVSGTQGRYVIMCHLYDSSNIEREICILQIVR